MSDPQNEVPRDPAYFVAIGIIATLLCALLILGPAAGLALFGHRHIDWQLWLFGTLGAFAMGVCLAVGGYYNRKRKP